MLSGKKEYFYSTLEQSIKGRELKNIHVSGIVSDQVANWLYAHAQLFVWPSLSEGFGLPGIEAMLHGLPVASSNATCLPEVYGDAAIYFDPLNTAEMASVIKNTLNNPALLRDLSAKGKQKAATYSWRRMAEQTLGIYQNALKK